MGAGKSTIARAIKQKLGYPVVEMDERIVKEQGMPISKIFETYGELWTALRKHSTLAEFLSGDVLSVDQVLASIPREYSVGETFGELSDLEKHDEISSDLGRLCKEAVFRQARAKIRERLEQGNYPYNIPDEATAARSRDNLQPPDREYPIHSTSSVSGAYFHAGRKYLLETHLSESLSPNLLVHLSEKYVGEDVFLEPRVLADGDWGRQDGDLRSRIMDEFADDRELPIFIGGTTASVCLAPNPEKAISALPLSNNKSGEFYIYAVDPNWFPTHWVDVNVKDRADTEEQRVDDIVLGRFVGLIRWRKDEI